MRHSMVHAALIAHLMAGLASVHAPLPAAPKRATRPVRTPADILRRREKQAAKLARRAERARKAGQR